VIPSLLRKGLCEAHVPLNSPFFKKISRTDIKMKNKPKTPIVSKKTVISFVYLDRRIAMFAAAKVIH
jgi:hypothetical protein